jgi:hypothetical protein
MTVAYQTGAASDPADFLSKLGTFAAANGFTVDTVSGGVVFHADDIVVGANAGASAISLRGGTAYDGGAAWNAQTNAATTNAIMDSLGVGPYTAYHFFVGDEDGDRYVHAALEITAGLFRHLAFGQLVKYGTYTGGVYVDAVDWSQSSNHANQPTSVQHSVICDANYTGSSGAHVYIDYDSKTNNFQYVRNDSTTPYCIGSCRSQGIYAPLIAAQGAKWNVRTPMFPMEYFTTRASSLYSAIGRIPHMRYLSLRNLGPGDEITVGGETWKCFPIVQRTTSSGSSSSTVNASQYDGYAYLMP